MAKNKYTPDFELFWSAYPRKTAKIVAFKAWTKQGIEGDAFLPLQIVQNIEKRSRLKWWNSDHSKIPHASTWINQARWEDDGWEDEIKTRTDGKATAGPPVYTPTVDDGPDLSFWQMTLNKLMRNYIMIRHGVPDGVLTTLIKTKNAVYDELLQMAIEELEMASDKIKARGQMSFLMADTMLSRFDNITGFNLKTRCIDMSQKGAA